MSQITAATVPSRGVCNLKVDITSVATTPTVDIAPKEAVMYQVDNTPGNDVLLTSLVMNIGAKRKDLVTDELIGERMWLTGGTIVTNSAGDEVVRYTATYRGLPDSLKAVPVATDALARNQIAHDEGEVCTIAADWLFRQQANTYLAGSSTISRAYGETIAANKPWMFGVSPNEAKIFEYDGTNPAQGITLEAGILDDVKVVATFGYKQPDFPGSWTPGVLYVDIDATFNQSPTATSKPFGQILNDTDGGSDLLQITGFAPSNLQKAITAENQAGINDTKYTTPLGVRENTAADPTLAKTTGDFSLGGIITFADDKARSTTNAAPINDLSFVNKKYFDDNSAAEIKTGSRVDASGGTQTAGVITNYTVGIDALSDMSGGIFTAPATGDYLITFGGQSPALSAEVEEFTMTLKKNTTSTMQILKTSGGTQDATASFLSCTRILPLAAADTLEVVTGGDSLFTGCVLVIQRLP